MPLFTLPVIASIAALGASHVANTVADRQRASARDKSLAAELRRQQGLDREADALHAQSRARYDDFAQRQDERAGGLAEMFRAAPQAAPQAVSEANASAGAVMPTATNDIVVREIANQAGKARQFTDQQADARAELRSFGDVLADTSLAQARDSGAIAQIGGFKSGSSGVLPYELDAANQKGGGAQFLGDILGGAGSIGLNYGLSDAIMKGATLPSLPTWAGKAAKTTNARPVPRPVR